ncbi:MAG: hypothetical protein WA906_05340, partial [Pacificimonas sp.]
PGLSAAIVLISAVLGLALLGAAAGAVLFSQGFASGLVLLIVGGVVALASIAWFGTLLPAAWLWLLSLHRMASIIFGAIRITAAFAVINMMVSIETAIPFAFASLVGGSSSIVPAGLGVSEILAAFLAETTGLATAATAFLAVALNRISAILFSAVLLAVLQIVKAFDTRRTRQPTAQ